MTLRESEQSLLHNPFHVAPSANNAPGAHKGKRPSRTSKFIPYISLSATLLAATMWFALNGLAKFDQNFEQITPRLSQTGQDFVSEENYFSSRQIRTKNNPTNSRIVDRINRDVIIEPLGSGFEPHLKKLTANQGANELTPFEIPASRILDMLNVTSDENIVISPGLKFYPTNSANIIRACPKGANQFDQVAAINRANDSTCFTIKTRPVQARSAKGRRVL